MYTTIAVIAGFAVLEQVFNGYKWPKQPYWILRSIFWFALLIGISNLLGRYLDPYAHGLTVFDLSGWGIWGAPVALFFYEVLIYFVHRAQHRVDFLWRMHQWHHSSERIDIWSVARIHPLELPLFHIIGLIAFAVVFKLSKETSGGLITFLLLIQYIQHTNVKTPRWLGYIIVRPENHMLHHAREKHHSITATYRSSTCFSEPLKIRKRPLLNLDFGTVPPPALSITFCAGTIPANQNRLWRVEGF